MSVHDSHSWLGGRTRRRIGQVVALSGAILTLRIVLPPATSRRQRLHAALAELGMQFPALFSFMAALVAVCACEVLLCVSDLCSARGAAASLRQRVMEAR